MLKDNVTSGLLQYIRHSKVELVMNFIYPSSDEEKDQNEITWVPVDNRKDD